jgi:hypothetical protein
MRGIEQGLHFGFTAAFDGVDFDERHNPDSLSCRRETLAACALAREHIGDWALRPPITGPNF